jgi:hypothetical protein
MLNIFYGLKILAIIYVVYTYTYIPLHNPLVLTLQKPLPERKSPTGWRNAPALNPKMRRGLSVLLVW